MSTRPISTDKLTLAEFLADFGGREGRFELVDGEPVLMAGANRRHMLILGNLFLRLSERLAGGPCRVLSAGMGLATTDNSYRLPDLGIYCDPRDFAPMSPEPMTLAYPKVLIEILSRSTERGDYGNKLDEYCALPSVDTIVHIHAKRDAFTVFERMAPLEWLSTVHLPGRPLVLRDPAVDIPAELIFAGTR